METIQRLDPASRKKFCEMVGIKHVPVIGTFPMQVLDTVLGDPDQIEIVLRYANGKSALVDKLREGLVFKQVNGQSHFKAVSNEYLIKYKRG